MASSLKQLWEHLKEQQEPFILERRIMSNHPKRTCICNLNKSQIYTKNILKLILCKFVHVKCSMKGLNSHKVQKHNLISKMAKKLRQIGEYHDFSMCGINNSPNQETQALHLWRNSQKSKYSNCTEKEVVIYTNKLRESEDNKKLKPRSFSDEAPVSSIGFRIRIPDKGEEDDASSSSTVLTENVAEGSVSSALLSETEKLNQAEFMELNGIVTAGYLELPENKSIIQQSEQLLFDCITKTKGTHERKKKSECTQGAPGLVELEKTLSWRSQKPTQKINFDVSDIIKDWNYMQQVVIGKIVIEVEDVIMNELIQEVIHLVFV